MFRQYDSVLCQQTADLVDQLRAAGDLPTAGAVKALQIVLLNRLPRNISHVRPGHGLADCFGIVGVVLLRLYIRLDELRRRKPHREIKA